MILFCLGLLMGVVMMGVVFVLNVKKLEKNGLEVDIRSRKIRTNGKRKPIMYSDKKAIELEKA